MKLKKIKQAGKSGGGTRTSARKTILRELGKGEYFRLRDSGTAQVWVRGEYVREPGKYSTYKFDDVCHERLRKGNTEVFAGFIF
jgi:hypothetical protein